MKHPHWANWGETTKKWMREVTGGYLEGGRSFELWGREGWRHLRAYRIPNLQIKDGEITTELQMMRQRGRVETKASANLEKWEGRRERREWANATKCPTLPSVYELQPGLWSCTSFMSTVGNFPSCGGFNTHSTFFGIWNITGWHRKRV